MDLRQMEYLVAVADERHFTRAAELAGISQSGLSAAIRSLETELGTQLFDRSTRKVDLTDAGMALLPYARSMITQAADARDAVVKASREVTGTLRIGSEQCLGIVDVVVLLERFHRRHPRVETHFVQTGSGELISLVRSGDLDIAFVAAASHLGALSHRSLGAEPLVLLTPADHPLAGGGWSRVDTPWHLLQGQDFIDFTQSWGVRELNDQLLAHHGVHRRVRCTVNDVHTLIDLVARGLGVAIVPRHVAAKPQASGLKSLPLPETDDTWTVSMVTAARERPDTPLAHLIDLLADTPACGSAANTAKVGHPASGSEADAQLQ